MNVNKLFINVIVLQYYYLKSSLLLSREFGLISQYSSECIYCNKSMSLEGGKPRHGVRSMMCCNNKKCRKRYSIFIGSILENSKLKISEILRIINYFFYGIH